MMKLIRNKSNVTLNGKILKPVFLKIKSNMVCPTPTTFNIILKFVPNAVSQEN